MSADVQSSVVFLDLPDFSHLCCVTLARGEEEEDLRSEQMKTCRELVLLYSDVLASPALESFTEITVVMALKFYQMGVIQMFGARHRLMLASPQCVFPGVLQSCLSFSVITRLSPSWNKVGLFLVSGKDFVSERGKMDAVRVEWTTSEGQLCISVEANTIRIPPATLDDFDLPPMVLRRFWNDPDLVLEPSPAGRVWCHVLPSMKKGQIITISRKLPQDGPFRIYGDLQNHWKSLYGYSLPDLPEEELVYCSVYFRLVGERLFTYPLSCIRLLQVQRCPRGDQQGALSSFLSDISTRLQSVCGFPTCLSWKCVDGTGAAQVRSDDINLSTASSSSLPLLHVPTVQVPTMPHFRSQRSALLSQQDRAQRLLGSDYGFRPSWSQASVSSSSPFVPTSSCVFSSAPPPEQTSPPNLAPTFKNKCPSGLISRQKELMTGASQEKGRGPLPSFSSRTPPIAASSPYSRLTTMPFPVHNLIRARPRQSRLWVPPAPKVRCVPEAILKRSCEREVKEQRSGHSSDSSTQVESAGPDVEKTTSCRR